MHLIFEAMIFFVFIQFESIVRFNQLNPQKFISKNIKSSSVKDCQKTFFKKDLIYNHLYHPEKGWHERKRN